MDFQDILFLLIFFVFSFLPKKKKTGSLEDAADNQAELVRKKIEALKRKRSNSVLKETSVSVEKSKNTRFQPASKDFSAYKHGFLKYAETVNESQEVVMAPIFSTKVKEERKLEHSTKSLREKMKWHIILSKPICSRSFYGSFTNR